jgi:hypothetical protein
MLPQKPKPVTTPVRPPGNAGMGGLAPCTARWKDAVGDKNSLRYGRNQKPGRGRHIAESDSAVIT